MTTRWWALAAVILMGAALLITGWTTYSGVRDASATLLRGQADALEQTVRSELGPGPPAAEDLAAFLQDHGGDGVRYVAAVDGDGVVAAAGAPVGGVGWRDPIAHDMQFLDGRIRIDVRMGQRRGRHGGGGWPGHVVVELAPVQADALRGAALRTLGIGTLAAIALLAIAVSLVRRILAREALERKLAHDRRLASLGEMSAVLAHEIRNPLASLKGNAQLLAEQLPRGEKPRAKADRVVAEAARLETLTNDLLEFVRTGTLARAAVDPGALLRETAALVDPGIPVDTTGAPPTWNLDGERLRQVLRNLLDNAVAAGPPVAAAVRGEGGRLVFEIADHGPGVPPEDAERIFEPFFTKRTQGTGLGLAVAKRIVELHGGTIAVDAAPHDGGGARFRVILPKEA